MRAIFFGSIGALVETSDMQRRAFNAAFTEAGVAWLWEPAVYREMLTDSTILGGRDRIERYAALTGDRRAAVQAATIHARKSAIFQEMLLGEGVPLRDGVAPLIAAARREGIMLALVSGTSAANIDAIFAGLGDRLSRGAFALVTSADDIVRGKPDPEIYRVALARLGLRPDDVVAIEDSEQSVAAAVAAGVPTLAVPGAFAAGQDFSRATAVVASLAECATPALLAQRLAG